VLELKPKAFLLENVTGLTSKRHRHLLERQLERVKNEYRIAYKVLDASRYGVPQRRERLFVLGIRKDLGVVPSFPLETHAPEPRVTLDGRKIAKWVTVREAIGDLLEIPPNALLTHKFSVTERIALDRNACWSPFYSADRSARTLQTTPHQLVLSPEQVERIKK
jgi:DNA (cytosine-5)-methyltransferase 1